MARHLAKGSVEPLAVEGSEVRFYSMRFCPCAHRVQLVLTAKDVPHDTVYINLLDKPEWYLDVFPAGKVPALVYDNTFLSESLLLADFLDEVYPEPPLWNDNPLQKILDKVFMDSFGKVETSFYKFLTSTIELEKENFYLLVDSLKPIEAELVQRGSKYFGGDSPKMVDYMIWPWFERLDAVTPYSNGALVIPFEEQFPNLADWKALMISDEVVASYYLTPERHAEFLTNRKAGIPSFDVLNDDI